MGAEASSQHQGSGGRSGGGEDAGKMGRLSRAKRERHRRREEAAAAAAAAAVGAGGVADGQSPGTDPAGGKGQGSSSKPGSRAGSKPGTPLSTPSKIRRGLSGLKHSVQRRFSFSSTSTINECGATLRERDKDVASICDSRRSSISRRSKSRADDVTSYSSRDDIPPPPPPLAYQQQQQRHSAVSDGRSREHTPGSVSVTSTISEEPVTCTPSSTVTSSYNKRPEGISHNASAHHSPSVPVLGLTAARIKSGAAGGAGGGTGGSGGIGQKYYDGTPLPPRQSRLGSSMQSVTTMGVESLGSKGAHSVDSVHAAYGYHGVVGDRRSNPLLHRLSPPPCGAINTGSYTLPHKRSSSANAPLTNSSLSSARAEFFGVGDGAVEPSEASTLGRAREQHAVQRPSLATAATTSSNDGATGSHNIDKKPINTDPHKMTPFNGVSYRNKCTPTTTDCNDSGGVGVGGVNSRSISSPPTHQPLSSNDKSRTDTPPQVQVSSVEAPSRSPPPARSRRVHSTIGATDIPIKWELAERSNPVSYYSIKPGTVTDRCVQPVTYTQAHCHVKQLAQSDPEYESSSAIPATKYSRVTGYVTAGLGYVMACSIAEQACWYLCDYYYCYVVTTSIDNELFEACENLQSCVYVRRGILLCTDICEYYTGSAHSVCVSEAVNNQLFVSLPHEAGRHLEPGVCSVGNNNKQLDNDGGQLQPDVATSATATPLAVSPGDDVGPASNISAASQDSTIFSATSECLGSTCKSEEVGSTSSSLPDYSRLNSVESIDLHDAIVERNIVSESSVDLDEIITCAADEVFSSVPKGNESENCELKALECEPHTDRESTTASPVFGQHLLKASGIPGSSLSNLLADGQVDAATCRPTENVLAKLEPGLHDRESPAQVNRVSRKSLSDSDEEYVRVPVRSAVSNWEQIYRASSPHGGSSRATQSPVTPKNSTPVTPRTTTPESKLTTPEPPKEVDISRNSTPNCATQESHEHVIETGQSAQFDPVCSFSGLIDIVVDDSCCVDDIPLVNGDIISVENSNINSTFLHVQSDETACSDAGTIEMDLMVEENELADLCDADSVDDLDELVANIEMGEDLEEQENLPHTSDTQYEKCGATVDDLNVSMHASNEHKQTNCDQLPHSVVDCRLDATRTDVVTFHEVVMPYECVNVCSSADLTSKQDAALLKEKLTDTTHTMSSSNIDEDTFESLSDAAKKTNVLCDSFVDQNSSLPSESYGKDNPEKLEGVIAYKNTNTGDEAEASNCIIDTLHDVDEQTSSMHTAVTATTSEKSFSLEESNLQNVSFCDQVNDGESINSPEVKILQAPEETVSTLENKGSHLYRSMNISAKNDADVDYTCDAAVVKDANIEVHMKSNNEHVSTDPPQDHKSNCDIGYEANNSAYENCSFINQDTKQVEVVSKTEPDYENDKLMDVTTLTEDNISIADECVISGSYSDGSDIEHSKLLAQNSFNKCDKKADIVEDVFKDDKDSIYIVSSAEQSSNTHIENVWNGKSFQSEKLTKNNDESSKKVNKQKRSRYRSKTSSTSSSKGKRKLRHKHNKNQHTIGTMTISEGSSQYPDTRDQGTMVNFDLCKATQHPHRVDQCTMATDTPTATYQPLTIDCSITSACAVDKASDSESVGYYSSSYSEFESSDFEEADTD